MTPNQLLRRAEMYVGRTCLPGRFDCVHLAVLVQEEVFGRKVGRLTRERHPVSPVAQHLLIEACRDTLADQVEEPDTGDVVLFKHAAHVRGTDLVDVWHVGTLFLDGLGQPWVLHTHDGCRSAVLEPQYSCKARGLRLDGYYRWKVAA